jgi:hypothetical protein
MRRAERIRALRSIERDLERASNLLSAVFDRTRKDELARILPGDDAASTLLRDLLHAKAFTELDSTPIYTARRHVAAVRRLMDGKP